MIDAKVNILTALFFFLDEPGCQASASGIDHVATLFSLHRWMKAQILSTGQTQRTELLIDAKLLRAVFHQFPQLCQCLLDLGHCS